jgi:serine/threonine-protein kinase
VFAFWLYTEYFSSQNYPLNRVAVLPFRNISPTADHDYFAEGMTEELISSLSRISGLEIIARSSVIQYKEASLDFGFIGEKLRAGALVEGSVRHFGDSVRVTVRLVDASSERLLWDEDYNRPAANALKIQDNIALNVAGALRVQLLDTERSDLENEAVYHPDAWRYYLLGRYHLNKRTSEDVMKSIDYFSRSGRSDSTFAPSFAGLAEAYVLVAGAGYGSTPREKALTEAIDAADKAIDLDPRLAEAFAVRGYILYRLLWNWKDADSLFKRAIKLKPSYARGHEWYALYQSLRGRTAEGLAQMRIAASLDPQSLSVATGVGRLLSFDGQQQASIDHLTKVIREHPAYPEAYFALAMSESHAKQYDASLRHFEKALELSDRREIILAEYGRTLGMAGYRDKALAILAELEELVERRPGLEWMLFEVHTGLGDYDRALTLMEQAFENQEGLMAYIETERLPEPIIQHPRYKALVKKIWKDDRP